ncbi:MAG: hypothetical protein U1F76_08715 [Candidatus Competibacteraceae bacterium]
MHSARPTVYGALRFANVAYASYRTWLNGPKPKDLAVALRETQLSFIKDDNEPLRDPRVWAPFVLVEGP